LINKNNEEEILWDVVRNCVAVLEFEDVVIYTKNKKNQLIQTAAYGKKDKNGKISERLILSSGEGIIGSVAETGQGIIVNDLSKDDRYIVDIVRKNSELSVPIKYQGMVLGVIDSEHPQKNFYTPTHLKVIETIAALTAVKIVQARSENEVAKSEKKLRSILESSPDLIFILNKDGVYKEVYTINENLLAAPKEQLIGKKIDLFFSKEDASAIRETIADVLKTKQSKTIEYSRNNSNNEKVWFSTQVSFFEYQNKSSVIFISRDNTEKRKARNEISKSQKLLTSINKNISEGIYRSFAAGGLVYVNKSFVEMFGYNTAQEVLALESKDLYANPSKRDEYEVLGKRKKLVSNNEALFKRKDGSTFLGLNNYMLTTDQDGNEIFDGAIRDISEQTKNAKERELLHQELLTQNKELALKEQELEAFNEELISNRDNLVNILEELSDRNFELDQLIYRTSHDLRAPLRSVLGLTNLYKLEVENPPNTYVEKIEDRIHKMDDFIKSMLDYSRANRLSIDYLEVDVEKIFEDCILDLEFLDGFKSVEIIKEVAKTDITAKVDVLRLKIILSNIISNVFKYRNTKIQNSFLKLNLEVLSTEINISISDNGIGIEKEYLNKVFDMFYRATETSEGSGLGMYIVKQSVDKLEGSITVESEIDVGTTFKLILPNHD
jgi:PAS domain S-box-containing protein